MMNMMKCCIILLRSDGGDVIIINLRFLFWFALPLIIKIPWISKYNEFQWNSNTRWIWMGVLFVLANQIDNRIDSKNKNTEKGWAK